MNRKVDLIRTVKIKHRDIEVYPEKEFMEDFEKPDWGMALNKKAILKFNQFLGKKRNNTDAENKIKKIIEMCNLNGSIFVSYDFEEDILVTKTWGF